MKCVCGYEQKNDFNIVTYTVPITDRISRQCSYEKLYFCPKCGTVKIKIKEMKGEK